MTKKAFKAYIQNKLRCYNIVFVVAFEKKLFKNKKEIRIAWSL